MKQSLMAVWAAIFFSACSASLSQQQEVSVASNQSAANVCPPSHPRYQECMLSLSNMAEMQQALDNPAGQRAGDEKMTCAQIEAELQTTRAQGVSAENRAEAEAAGMELKRAQEQAAGEAQALAAAGTGQTAAAAAIDSVTSTNVAGGANTAAMMAEQKALQERSKRQLDPARVRAAQANADARADFVASMQANPRFGRLIQLV